MSKNQVNRSGLNIVGVLLVIFIVLKLCHLINWSWIWVLSPLWISFLVIFVLFVIAALVTIADDVANKRK